MQFMGKLRQKYINFARLILLSRLKNKKRQALRTFYNKNIFIVVKR